MSTIANAYGRARVKLAAKATRILTDTCRLIIEGEEPLDNVPCQFSGGSGNMDGAPYRIKFAWDSPAVIGAAAVVDEIEGRPQLTLQLVQPVDSSTALWQEWKATSGPAYGRHDVGL